MNRPKFQLQNNEQEKDKEKHKQERQKRTAQSGIIYLIVNLIGLWLFQQFILSPVLIHETEISYSDFKSKIQSEQIVSVTLGTDRHVGTIKATDSKTGTTSEVPFTVNAMPNGDPTLI